MCRTDICAHAWLVQRAESIPWNSSDFWDIFRYWISVTCHFSAQLQQTGIVTYYNAEIAEILLTALLLLLHRSSVKRYSVLFINWHESPCPWGKIVVNKRKSQIEIYFADIILYWKCMICNIKWLSDYTEMMPMLKNITSDFKKYRRCLHSVWNDFTHRFDVDQDWDLCDLFADIGCSIFDIYIAEKFNIPVLAEIPIYDQTTAKTTSNWGCFFYLKHWLFFIFGL